MSKIYGRGLHVDGRAAGVMQPMQWYGFGSTTMCVRVCVFFMKSHITTASFNACKLGVDNIQYLVDTRYTPPALERHRLIDDVFVALKKITIITFARKWHPLHMRPPQSPKKRNNRATYTSQTPPKKSLWQWTTTTTTTTIQTQRNRRYTASSTSARYENKQTTILPSREKRRPNARSPPCLARIHALWAKQKQNKTPESEAKGGGGASTSYDSCRPCDGSDRLYSVGLK